ncbi:MAG: hydrogenobyrinic acid a,c-diamide synthase (glutamine-hydrolyzing) [Proteobacteria bacterium]|nr:hydrogenobyrinic acid a,c-diamide synthase (glutamine-hydrolyzing) [Pseudomonadota bacterium]MBU1234329.1 hydrogenobyrinic acid a,c-diamide synthase (glutamine-hydrolyzing) [Pseudomonadota bacterium]MBU1420693.1 hydrogenobyrinic acid a,c-diamide synthase (glutamine-hydrolyzing) [Pseudomonadota bacterium]MBU1454610.1 hydrogenobyrinic acid a,c-diamide synthase (glutamine-hydrolyzing) [Pseudomonadota bacterium]
MTKGIVVAGLSGGSGKSVVSVGLTAALARQGKVVVPFKKGPDYIDAGWLKLAAGRSCYNLDPYLMSMECIRNSFLEQSTGADIAILEGNRGLYDGVNPEGGYSTAELSLTLNLPVLLVVNCTKTTRTVAAMVLGCLNLDERIDIRGVVLNQIGTKRHESIVTQAVETYTGIPVLGAVPRMKKDIFPMRHLGVTPHQEYEGSDEAMTLLANTAEEHLDLGRIQEIMAPVGRQQRDSVQQVQGKKLRIGLLMDAAFQFYYSENLEALERGGAELVAINAMEEKVLPELDGLYIGGGFPETSAGALAANKSFRNSVKTAAAAGLPIYAECGGLIYLGESIELEGEVHLLAGVFPIRFGMSKKPQAHGYSIFEVDENNPFYPLASEVRGHEFRYSTVLEWSGNPKDLALKMKRGVGFVGGRDGLTTKNVLALYTHVHALGTPEWAKGFLGRCREVRDRGGLQK